ncbi:MAG TPA: SDR family oxidoreductase [Anaerolineae bacterium]|nr:SDR family oxidoreductase [Anaerolineae bacterium]
MDLKVLGKSALITGSSRGLGFAIALKLAEEGCKIAINGRSEENLLRAAEEIRGRTGTSVGIIPGDVTDSQFPKELIQKTIGLYGGLDLLVTNAGGPPAGSFESFDDDTWQHAVDLSFLSHMRIIREALPYLRKSECASVLTMTSYSVKQPIPNLILSNSIRSATIGLTKTLALELGGEGIRFNSILPGWTKTERVIELLSYRAKTNNTTVEEEIQKQALNSPLGRMASPEELANAAVFLLSPAASYITGVMLTVDGGMYKGTY